MVEFTHIRAIPTRTNSMHMGPAMHRSHERIRVWNSPDATNHQPGRSTSPTAGTDPHSTQKVDWELTATEELAPHHVRSVPFTRTDCPFWGGLATTPQRALMTSEDPTFRVGMGFSPAYPAMCSLRTRATVSGSSGVIVGRTHRPISISRAISFFGRRQSRFHQCLKSP
jgi:hypothetical protein